MIFTPKKQEVTSVTTTLNVCSIKEYLAVRSIVIESTEVDNEKYHNTALAEFACKIAALQVKGGDPFLKYIRTCIIKKDCRCNFSLNNLTADEQKACIDIANLLCSIGALTNALECNGILRGNFSITSTRLINFVNGGFLEIAIYALTKRILTECVTDYELLPNVICSAKEGKKEYDLLLRVGGEFYVFEIKSGRTDKQIEQTDMFGYYKQRGIELGLYPDHQMFITGDRTEDEVSLISYFESMTIANYEVFSEKLMQMINQ